MQHPSCPEFSQQECLPSSRLSRQTLHTSQWKERSLKILKQKQAHHFADTRAKLQMARKENKFHQNIPRIMKNIQVWQKILDI